MTDAFSDANAIVTQVNQNGGESAARLMMDNVNNARADFKEPGINKVGSGYNDYMTVLSDELQKSGVLPELSIGWAKANIDVIGNGRAISDTDMRKFEHIADNSTNPVDQMMIKSLKDQAPDLKHASIDQNGHETVITSNDLNNRLDTRADYRQYSLPDELGKNPNALRAQTLLADGGQLFDYLDGIRNDGEKDGQVSRNDLVTFNEKAKHDPGFARQFSPEQLNAVKELDDRWDYEGSSIHTNGIFTQNMTRETIAKGLGFEDVPAQVKMEKALRQPHDLDDSVPFNHANEIREPVINDAGDNRNASRDQESMGDAVDNIFRDATQRVGEGPYQVAARLLPGASHKDIMQLTRAMKNDYQERTGDHSDRLVHMKVGEHLLNPANLEKILASSPALRNRLQNCARR